MEDLTPTHPQWWHIIRIKKLGAKMERLRHEISWYSHGYNPEGSQLGPFAALRDETIREIEREGIISGVPYDEYVATPLRLASEMCKRSTEFAKHVESLWREEYKETLQS